MPSLPLAACRVSTCPERAAYRGYCKGHARDRERERGTASQRGYGVYWRQRRHAYLLAHPFCDQCPAPATEPDHIVTIKQSLAQGWSWVDIHADSNLRPKCKRHHSQRTARDQSGWSPAETEKRLNSSASDQQCDRVSALTDRHDHQRLGVGWG